MENEVGTHILSTLLEPDGWRGGGAVFDKK